MRLPIIVAFLHKWIGLVIGIQILLWISGGVVMSWFPIDEVRGAHNVAEREEQGIYAGANLISASEAVASAGIDEATQVTARRWQERIVYEVRGRETFLVDAISAELLSPLDEGTARAVAESDFSGDGEIVFAELMAETNLEYRGALPVWRFDFNDQDDTHLYVSPVTGRIVARRNATWRLFDFFWMLHIMDYDERENFNHPLLISASITALVMVLMGIGLLFWRLRLRDWRVVFSLPRRK